ncbi:MAG: hypothetical protein LQ341_006056, partial [Variospora aurantia]
MTPATQYNVQEADTSYADELTAATRSYSRDQTQIALRYGVQEGCSEVRLSCNQWEDVVDG